MSIYYLKIFENLKIENLIKFVISYNKLNNLFDKKFILIIYKLKILLY